MTEKDTVHVTKELEAFRKYDKNRSGAIEIDELKALMADLGLLSGKSAAQIRECVVATFALADSDRDNALNMEEFSIYYQRVTAPSLVEALQAEYPDDLSGVQHAFNEWVCFGARARVKQTDAYLLGSAQWLKLCRDTGLVAALRLPSSPNPANKSQASSPPPISQQDADLIYAKVRPKGKQRIEFPQFLDALGLIAAKQGRDVIDVIRQITLTSGPVVNGTLVNVPRFESNASNHNGHNTVGGLSERQSTSSCVHKPKTEKANGKYRLSSEGFMIRAHRSTDEEETGHCAGDTSSSPILHRLHRVFKEFSEFGMGRELEKASSPSTSASPSASASAVSPASPASPASPVLLEMDSKQFVKLCKECGLSKSPSHMAAVDLAYAKAKSTRSTSRRLNFSQFLKALSLLAQDRGIDEDEIKEIVAGCKGPRRNSTTPDYCRLHDDKSTYTGVYAKGGPQTVDKSAPDLARLLDRSIAPA